MSVHLLTVLYELFDDDPGPVLAFLRRTAREYRLEEPLAVLDMGCGPGRLFPGLAELGWTVVGFEPDRRFCEDASARASGLEAVEVVLGGWKDLDLRERFDLAVAMNGPFAYLLTRADQVEALRRVYGSLRKEGVLVLDLPDLLSLRDRKEVVTTDSTEVDGHRIRLRRVRSFDFARSRYVQTNRYRIEDPDGEGKFLETTHHHCILTEKDLRELVSETGFRELRIQNGYGDEDGGQD
ncbi:MAG: class I SAM-dependent methyltransferase, partial [Thermoanaerobaculia bacterium]|nr:class I SAM-dependent methyltransferase [Thermoanaerobaculia bacterium]